ncbi:MAG: hypothetical protein FD123_2641 [Bacteroidetes bacterium]|nr:MAG: hypothetical protein FD123_2641 [Bacteroidota bacterium]
MFEKLRIRIQLIGLKGLKTAGFSRNGLRVSIGEESSREQIREFLQTLPSKFELSFFDYFHPQISDPGAYVSIQKMDNGFACMLANHGWSAEWKMMELEDLADYIYKNRQHTSDYFEIRPKVKDAVIGRRY